MSEDIPVIVTTYRAETSGIRAVKDYPSFNEFVSQLKNLCKVTSYKASVLSWDCVIGNFCIEDEYGVILIGIIEADAEVKEITLEEWFNELKN